MKPGLFSEVGIPTRPQGTPARVLTIGAHPDDAEFGSAGTLANWAAHGADVSMLVVTDGSKGSWDPDANPVDLALARKAEQRQAADAIGANEIVMLDHTDGELEYSMDLRRQLCEWIRRIRPNVVLSHDPWQRYQLHPDHRVTGQAAVDAVVAARDHLFFPELGLEKHRPDWIFLWSADEPNHWVDIGKTFDIKVEALLKHSSQSKTTMAGASQDKGRMAEFRARLTAWAQTQGEPAGIALAEAFRAIKP